jgi:hypothetical protein
MQEKNTACIACSRPLVEGGDFCPFCGTKIVSSSTTSAIDSYIQNKVNLELSNRLKDQNSLVREIGDKAEDVVWKRLTRYGMIAGALLARILGFIGFEGFKTLDDVKKRIDPIVSDAENRAKEAKRTVEEAAKEVVSVKTSLDHLSHDVDTQTKRVTEKSGEISQKLQGFDAAITDAQKRVEAYQARSEELSRRLEVTAKTLDQQANRVTQVSKQVDNVSIRQAYPTLGKEKFVTFNGSPWKGMTEKPPNERWVHIFIQPQGIGDYSNDQVEGLLAELKRSNYTPFLGGTFGVGGPYSSAWGAFGSSNETSVFYFKKDSEQMATAVCALVAKTLSIKAPKPQFVNPAAVLDNVDLRLVIEQSGLDLQIYLHHLQK